MRWGLILHIYLHLSDKKLWILNNHNCYHCLKLLAINYICLYLSSHIHDGCSFIQLDLGNLKVRNEFSWHGYPENDPSAVHLDILDAEVKHITSNHEMFIIKNI